MAMDIISIHTFDGFEAKSPVIDAHIILLTFIARLLFFIKADDVISLLKIFNTR